MGESGYATIILDKLWHFGEVSSDWKRRSVMPIFKKRKREDRFVILGFVCGKIVEQILLETMVKLMENIKKCKFDSFNSLDSEQEGIKFSGFYAQLQNYCSFCLDFLLFL